MARLAYNITIKKPKNSLIKFLSHLIRGKFFDGPNIAKFENEFKNYIGSKYAVATSSARYALYLVLKNLDISKGKDEVILSAYMPEIVARAATRCGLKPVFVDIDPDTLNIDPAEIEKKITKNTKVIILVHLYGIPCDIEKISKIAKKHNIFLLEDCAQALGASYKGKKIGSFGDANVYSFGVLKNINTYGGGMITTDNDILYQKIRKDVDNLPYPNAFNFLKEYFKINFKWIGGHPLTFSLITFPIIRTLLLFRLIDVNIVSNCNLVKSLRKTKVKVARKNFYKIYGVKYLNLQASFGLEQLKKYDEMISHQNKNADILNSCLKNYPNLSKDIYPAYFLYCAKFEDRYLFIKKFAERGVFLSSIHYGVIPELDLYKQYYCDCPKSREAAKNIVYLPFRTPLNEKDMMRIMGIYQQIISESKAKPRFLAQLFNKRKTKDLINAKRENNR